VLICDATANTNLPCMAAYFFSLPYLSVDGLCELGGVPAAFCGVALPQRRQAAGDSHMSPPLAAAVICHIRRLPCYIRRRLLNAANLRTLAWYHIRQVVQAARHGRWRLRRRPNCATGGRPLKHDSDADWCMHYNIKLRLPVSGRRMHPVGRCGPGSRASLENC